MKLPNMLVIVSACNGEGNDVQDSVNTDKLSQYLNHLNHSFCTGYWRGNAEKSLIVQCNDFADVGKVISAAKGFEQEAVLLVDANDNAFVYYLETRVLESKGGLYKSRDIPDAEAFTFFNGYYYYTL